MTTEKILTDPMATDLAWEYATGIIEVRAIEQAVLQSDHIRNMQGMADCMAMVHNELIEAGVINESVPPMMVANAVLAEIQALRKDAERYGWLKENIMEQYNLPGSYYLPDDAPEVWDRTIDAAKEQT